MSIAENFIDQSAVGRGFVRWGARVLAAHYLLVLVEPNTRPPKGVFDSLSDNVRDTAICITKMPLWLSISLIIIGLQLIINSFWWALRRYLEPSRRKDENKEGVERLLRDMRTRQVIHTIRRDPGATSIRRAISTTAFVAALLSGGTSMILVAVALVWLKLSSLWVWVVIATCSKAITAAERAVIDNLCRRLLPSSRPPSRSEAIERLDHYINQYPEESATASALLYAYSGLDRQEIVLRFFQLTSGALKRASRLIITLLVALLYPLVPAPKIAQLANQGFLGCLYVNTYTFFRIAQFNPASVAVVALISIALLPFCILHAYTRFMHKFEFPHDIRSRVFASEMRFSVMMVPFEIAVSIAWSGLIIAFFYLSALAASISQSAGIGALTLGLPYVMLGLGLQRYMKKKIPVQPD